MVSDPEPLIVPAFTVDGPIDPTGAGDSVSAGIVLALASGATLPEAALIGAAVGSVTVEQLGVCGVCTQKKLFDRITRIISD